MSNVSLFVVGTIVTLIVATSLSLLVWGAILDGRYEKESRVAEHERSVQARGDRALLGVDGA